MAAPSRILFAIPELDAGGPDRVFFELLTGLDRRRFEPILIVSAPEGRYLGMLPADVRIERIGGGRYPVLRVARAIDRLRPDLVFTTLRMNVTASAATCFQWHRPAFIARQANAIAADFSQLRKQSLVKHRLAEKATVRLLRRSDALVAQSGNMADELARHARRDQEIVVIGNPISVPEIEARRAQQSSPAVARQWGRPSIVAVGRLTPQKGFDVLLPAFAQFRRRFPDAGLSIWGEGPERRSLEAQAGALGLGDSVRLPGRSEAVLAEIAAADLFVSSSRYEGFSNAILEAMALGTPVAATNCEGATADLVLDGRTGILASQTSAEEICAAMIRAVNADRACLTAAAKANVMERYDKNLIVAQYSDLFERWIRRRASQ